MNGKVDMAMGWIHTQIIKKGSVQKIYINGVLFDPDKEAREATEKEEKEILNSCAKPSQEAKKSIKSL